MPSLLLVAAAYAAYKQKQDNNEDKNNKDGTDKTTRHELRCQETYETIEEEKDDDEAPPVCLDDKTLLELLPAEQEFGLYQAAPISTVTFCNGNIVDASQTIGPRLVKVLQMNPWLTGWVIRHSEEEIEQEEQELAQENESSGQREKEDDTTHSNNETATNKASTSTSSPSPTPARNGRVSPKLKLCFDPTGEDVSSGQFQLFYPGDIPLCRDTTPYQEFATLFEPHGVLVERNESLLGGNNNNDENRNNNNHQPLPGKNKAIFKVTLVPDADQPDERFAMVMSLSHLAGDACTYYKLLDMLLTPTVEIVALNPVRVAHFPMAMSKLCTNKTTDDSSLTNNKFNLQHNMALLSKPSLWNWGRQKWTQEVDPSELRIFAVSDEFVQREKKTQVVVEQVQQNGERLKEATATLDHVSSEATTGAATTNVSSNSVLTSHFFQGTNATVGFMVCNMRRNQLEECPVTELDAGNYTHDIGLVPTEFEAPEKVQGTLEKFRRRCRSCSNDILEKEENNASLNNDGNNDDMSAAEQQSPRQRRRRQAHHAKVPINFKLSMSVNWSTFWRGTVVERVDEVTATTYDGNDEQHNDTSELAVVENHHHHQPVLHFPIYDNDFVTKNLPLNFSMMKLFTLKPAREDKPMKLGAYIVAPRSAWSKIEASGMVDEYWWSFRRDMGNGKTVGEGKALAPLVDELQLLSVSDEKTTTSTRSEEGEEEEEEERPFRSKSKGAMGQVLAEDGVQGNGFIDGVVSPTPRRFVWSSLLHRRAGTDAQEPENCSGKSGEDLDDETGKNLGDKTGDDTTNESSGNEMRAEMRTKSSEGQDSQEQGGQPLHQSEVRRLSSLVWFRRGTETPDSESCRGESIKKMKDATKEGSLDETGADEAEDDDSEEEVRDETQTKLLYGQDDSREQGVKAQLLFASRKKTVQDTLSVG